MAFQWFLIAGIVVLAGGVFSLHSVISDLRKQVEHLHTVMLKELERR